MVSRDCHIYRIHQRFRYPMAWQILLSHVRRGGYAREMRNAEIKAQLATFRASHAGGDVPSTLTQLRPYPAVAGKEWFANLSLDLAQMEDPSSRLRA